MFFSIGFWSTISSVLRTNLLVFPKMKSDTARLQFTKELQSLLGFTDILKSWTQFNTFQWEGQIIHQKTYVRQGDRLTRSPSPPPRKLFLARHSSRGSALVGDPVNCGKTICRIVIPPCSRNTRSKLSAVNTFNPWCCGLVHESSIRVVHVVYSELHVNFLIRIKYVRFKLNGFTLILCPRRMVLKLMSSFLQWKTCIELKEFRHYFKPTIRQERCTGKIILDKS